MEICRSRQKHPKYWVLRCFPLSLAKKVLPFNSWKKYWFPFYVIFTAFRPVMTEQGERRHAVRCNLEFTTQTAQGDSFQGIRFTAVASATLPNDEYYTKTLREWLREYYHDKYGMKYGTGFDFMRGAFIFSTYTANSGDFPLYFQHFYIAYPVSRVEFKLICWFLWHKFEWDAWSKSNGL